MDIFSLDLEMQGIVFLVPSRKRIVFQLILY